MNLLFYAMWDYRYIPFILLVILITYASGYVVASTGVPAVFRRTTTILVTVFVVLSFLVFRLYGFENLIVPIGYSFYTLQALGYVYDVAAGRIRPEKKIYLYSTFVSFFPSVTSGPIIRAKDFLQALEKESTFSYDEIREGLLMMIYGMYVKNFVADRIAGLVDTAYDSWADSSGFVIMVGVALYAFQLYFDFMGYSCIAIGAGKTLGFDMGSNFRQPYFSCSVKEFWSRWHISLSEWLRDYVYFPLGGSRKGVVRSLINLLIVFLLSGFWHGKGYTFLVWGLLHGLYRIIEKISENEGYKHSGSKSSSPVLKGILVIRTFILVGFAWLFFRAENLYQAAGMITRIFTSFDLRDTFLSGAYTLGLPRKLLLLYLSEMLVIFLVDMAHEKGISIASKTKHMPLLLRWSLYIILVCAVIFEYIYYYGYSAVNFIYAGF